MAILRYNPVTLDENKVTQKVETVEYQVDDTTGESNIVLDDGASGTKDLLSVESRVTVNEGDITTIEGDITTIEGDITDLQTNKMDDLNQDTAGYTEGHLLTASAEGNAQDPGDTLPITQKVTENTVTTLTAHAWNLNDGNMQYDEISGAQAIEIDNLEKGTYLLLVKNTGATGDVTLTVSEGSYTVHYPNGGTGLQVTGGQESVISIAIFNTSDVYASSTEYTS